MEIDAIIAEYSAIRDEILQLNNQIFVAFTSSLGLNATVLGWMFSKNNPVDHIHLIAIGAFVLLLGNALSLNKNRLAHRLAYYQKFFIEERLPDIQWARAYFNYRDVYQKRKNHQEHDVLISLPERIAESSTLLIVSVQILNAVVAVIFWEPRAWIVGGLCGVFALINSLIDRALTDYKEIREAMEFAYRHPVPSHDGCEPNK